MEGEFEGRLTQVIRESRSHDGQICLRVSLPRIAKTDAFPADSGIRRSPADIKTSPTNSHIEIMLHAIGRFDARSIDLLNPGGNNIDIVLT